MTPDQVVTLINSFIFAASIFVVIVMIRTKLFFNYSIQRLDWLSEINLKHLDETLGTLDPEKAKLFDPDFMNNNWNEYEQVQPLALRNLFDLTKWKYTDFYPDGGRVRNGKHFK